MTLPYHIDQVDWEHAQPALCRIRFTVFVEEQGFAAEIELDGRDPECVHVLATDAAERPIGTARMLPDGHIGRVAVLAEWRGRGVGSALMRAVLEIARLNGPSRLELHSQVHAIPFYERLGFRAEGPEFDEAGAPHRLMVLEF